MESSFSNAPLVQMMNLPTWPPGARVSRPSLSTAHSSTPGMFLMACTILGAPPAPCASYTTRGPRRWTYLRFLIFPLPERRFRLSFTFSISAYAPIDFRSSTALEVLLICSDASLMMRGTSGIVSTAWPRAMSSAGTADAASAEHTAYLFCLRFTLRCHLRQVLVGANMWPPRHMLPNAPWPARWVPPPGTRGIRETARPVPQDSAAVW
mmetsp:Transcript_10845/g.40158  ORF Transcript_10845/g.40158 Transcript_10845/m.40158 type:complete len:209 (+) Transcript_10845:521-1147(+)